MENKKKNILLLTTGGTIASVPGGEGLEPHRSDVMERELDQLRTYYDITVRDDVPGFLQYHAGGMAAHRRAYLPGAGGL